jgi:hypothetical protein
MGGAQPHDILCPLFASLPLLLYTLYIVLDIFTASTPAL